MAIDFNEARLIIEAARKRGIIRAPGDQEPPPQQASKEATAPPTVLPDWLKEEYDPRDSYRRR
jgi:hypothetical protein